MVMTDMSQRRAAPTWRWMRHEVARATGRGNHCGIIRSPHRRGRASHRRTMSAWL